MYADTIALKNRPDTIWTLTTIGGTPVDVVKYSGTNVLVRSRIHSGRKMWWAPMGWLMLTPTQNPRGTKAARAKAAYVPKKADR